MRAVFPLPAAFWMEVARRSPEATFFHSPLWHRLVSAAWPGYRDRSVGVELPGGRRAVLPLLELARPMKGLFSDLESSFAGCYGGLVADSPLTRQERGAALRAAMAAHRIGRLYLTGNPRVPPGEQSLPGGEARDDATHIVALDGPPPSGSFSEGHRRALRKAARAWIEVRQGDGLEDYREYYGLYEQSLDRWGERATSRYPWELFEQGWRLSREHPGPIALWLARHEGRAVAGAWVFTWNRHAVYWHGATGTGAMPHSPGHALHAAILEHARAAGLASYDFNPSGGHAGVARFKAGFGAAEIPIRRWELTGRAYARAMALRQAVRR